MYSEMNDVENEIEVENEINGIDNGNINLDSDYQNLLSLEERKIIDKLNNVSNDTKKYLKKNKEFYNISLKELFDNFLKAWNEIIIEFLQIYNKNKDKNQNILFKNRYWWNNFKNIISELLYILTKKDRLIYVGFMLIIISFFMYFLLISS
jgi:hypothetical protein